MFLDELEDKCGFDVLGGVPDVVLEIGDEYGEEGVSPNYNF